MRSRLVLLDGHSLAYRAFYAMPPLSTRSGEPINAVLGFVNMLLKSVENETPSHLVVSFDRGRATARLEHYAEYKAGRESMPEGLHLQMPVIEEVVRAFGIPIFTSAEHEADDCIGTLARRAEELGYEVVIVSGDLDLLQVVDANIRVMATIRGLSETVRYDEAAVKERFGFEPERIPDFKALAGDSSDNIPGVTGIGKGSAARLIADFGTVEQLLERIDEVPPRYRERIRSQADDVRTFKQLATIHTDLPLEISWDECRWSRVPDSAAALLERLEFRRIVERLGLKQEAAEPQAIEPVVETEVAWVRDDADLERAAQDLARAPLVGLAWIRQGRHTVALAACGDPSLAWVIPVDTPVEGQLPFERDGLPPSRICKALLSGLGSAGRTAWAFDLKAALVEWGLEAFPEEAAFRDVGLASYLLESGESQKSLQAIATRHGAPVAPDADELFGKGARSVAWHDIDEERRKSFAGRTAASTRAVAEILSKCLADERLESLFLDVDMPLVRILARMETEGVALDAEGLRKLGTEMEGELERIRREILEAVGFEFNINSPKRLGEVLFDHLKLPGGKRTKTGAYTTDAEVLASLVDQHPVCRLVMEFRELAKLESTYVDALPQLVRPATGRLHTSWNVTVAATGRLSSSEPNLQNIPVRSGLGRRIREAFVAGGEGMVLLSADYSQIELRIMAHLSQDPRLLEVFRAGGDVHTATASQIFGVPPAEVTTDMRRKAKEVNFGIIYGMGPEGLATRIHVSRREARTYIDSYLENFAGVRTFTEQTEREAEEKGYVSTMLGRRRYLPDMRSKNRMVRAAAARMAVNAPIQGSAADLVKVAMVGVDRQIHGLDVAPEARLPARMILQVHDELVFEVPEARVIDVAEAVRRIMECGLPMSVPVQVDLKWGTDWARMQPLQIERESVAGV